MAEPTANEELKQMTAAKIGVIVCSQRKPRCGLQVSTMVFNALKQYQSQHESPKPYELTMIDLADHPLPLFDEPGVPATISTSAGYAHAHTRAWSELISSMSAFVFVTPQYNWGYPASIKNAIDYLFNEWNGKPAMVVSYGSHGGDKAAAQLKQVLEGTRMKVVPTSVGLAFPDKAFLFRAALGEDLELEKGEEGGAGGGMWPKEKKEIGEAFGELINLLAG